MKKCANTVSKEKTTGSKLSEQYPYGLNERTKLMNQDIPIGKLFPALPRYGNKYIEQRTRQNRNLNHPLSELNYFTDHINSIDPKCRGNRARKLHLSTSYPYILTIKVLSISKSALYYMMMML